MNHQELIEHLKKFEKLKGNDELAQLILLKKAEHFIRDFIVLEIDKSLNKGEKNYHTVVREINNHDIVLLDGELNKGKFIFKANTIIELKYTYVPWLLEKSENPLDDLEIGQDNIWRENMTYKSQLKMDKNNKKIE